MKGKKVITKQRIEEFCTYLKGEEKSRAAVEKYRRDLEKLAVLLGHSSIETTRLYVKITKEECQRELDRMRVVF